MWNLLGFTIVTICVCAHQISAQRQEKLTAMNGYLKNIIANAQIMQAMVQAELGQNIPNPKPNPVYDNFLEAGEMRLQVLEASTAALKTAIGSPNKNCEVSKYRTKYPILCGVNSVWGLLMHCCMNYLDCLSPVLMATS